jgi:hypothetical protein
MENSDSGMRWGLTMLASVGRQSWYVIVPLDVQALSQPTLMSPSGAYTCTVETKRTRLVMCWSPSVREA